MEHRHRRQPHHRPLVLHAACRSRNPTETTGADGKYWVTTSGGNEGAAAAVGKVWIVADLGATYHLATLKIWNFNWDNTASTPDTSLNNRGVSQFDFLVRDSQADTSTGLIGGAAINLNNPVDGNIDDDAVFNLGTSDPWTTAISNQALAAAVNNDAHAATSFDLTGQTARFVAIRVDSYYGESGIGLGKVRFEGTLVGGNAFAEWLADSAPAIGFITDSDNDAPPPTASSMSWAAILTPITPN